MVGGDKAAVDRLAAVFTTLAPPDGWLHVGGIGAGHYVKMIHNGIEYAMMQGYAEGFELMSASEYGLDLPKIARLWNQGSVVRSWLLELAAAALAADPKLDDLKPYVEDSGEGRWTVEDAVDKSVPGAHHHRRALRALPLAARQFVRGPAARRAPQPVRWPCRTPMSRSRSSSSARRAT